MNLNFFQIPRAIRNLSRFQEIVFKVGEYGFYEILSRLSLGVPLPRRREEKKGEPAERFVRLLEELGPTFIKLGQVLSTRADLLPKEWISELTRLQDRVEPTPFPEIEKVLKKELPDYLSIFSEIEDEPLASASLGQVHGGVLKTGEKVVLKIIRPGIREIVERDLELIRFFARLLEDRVEELRPFRPTGVAREFERSIRNEMNLLREGRNIERFRRNFSDHPHIVFPKTYPQWNTETVLIMERIEGVKLTDYKQVGGDPEVLSRIGVELIFKMVFEDRFFHADPHPGNVWVLPGNRVAILDMGMADVVLPQTRDLLVDMLAGVALDDPEKIVEAVLTLSHTPEEIDLNSFRREIYLLYEDYVRGAVLEQTNITALFQACMDTARKFHLQIPTDIVLLLRALATMEGVGKQLNPKVDLVEAARPYVMKILESRLGPDRMSKEAVEILGDLYRLLKSLPNQIRGWFQQELEGRKRIRIVWEQPPPVGLEIARAIRLLTLTILVLPILFVGYYPTLFPSHLPLFPSWVHFLLSSGGTLLLIYLLYSLLRGKG
jgi:ubiquinone biosynthesis protein